MRFFYALLRPSGLVPEGLFCLVLTRWQIAKFLAVGDNRPLRGFATHGEANTPSGARAESRANTNNKTTKGKSDEYGWVVNRRPYEATILGVDRVVADGL